MHTQIEVAHVSQFRLALFSLVLIVRILTKVVLYSVININTNIVLYWLRFTNLYKTAGSLTKKFLYGLDKIHENFVLTMLAAVKKNRP